VAAVGTLIVLFAVEAGRGPAGVALGGLTALSLLFTVGFHRLRRPSAGCTTDRTLLRTPGQVALAAALAISAGSVVALVAALLLAAADSGAVGDGNVAIRLLLGLVATCSSVAVGSRCARWWAFAGALGLVPLLGYAMLVDGKASTSGIDFLVVAVLASALGLAVGSLNRDLAESVARERRRPRSVARQTTLSARPHREKRAAVRGG